MDTYKLVMTPRMARWKSTELVRFIHDDVHLSEHLLCPMAYWTSSSRTPNRSAFYQVLVYPNRLLGCSRPEATLAG